MCGIAGIVNKTTQSRFDTNSLELMSDAIKHRGPDDQGYIVFNKNEVNRYYGTRTNQHSINLHQLTPLPANQTFDLAFVQNRLSIIDLSPLAHQPMCYNNYWITFNGEIYNYKTLKTELELKGYSFKSQSDTEVLIALYAEYKSEMVKKLNGMWAFVIYDPTENILFGSRDHLGVKPLYYINSDTHFAFSSEIKGLVNIPNLSTKIINKNEIWNYLITGIIENDTKSIWEDIIELKPGTNLTLNTKTYTLKIEHYRSTLKSSKISNESFTNLESAIKQTEVKLKEAIKVRIHCDVKVGVSLSGGLDSSAICALAQDIYFQENQSNINAYTVSFPQFKNDETQYAQIVAENSNVNWHCVNPENKIDIKKLEHIVYMQDIPFWGINLYSHYSLLEHVAKDKIKVFLEGQGGDELFGGYQHHLIAYLNESIKKGNLKSVFNIIYNYKNTGYPLFKIVKEWGKLVLQQNFKFFNQLTNDNHAEYKAFNTNNYSVYKKEIEYKLYNTQNLSTSLKYDSEVHFLKFLLRATDRTSMAHGVECRTAFADDIELINYVNQLPSNFKIKNGFSKFLLRKSIQKYLPKSITWRTDKKGFSSPDAEWLKHIIPQLEPYFITEIEEYFSVTELKKLFNNYLLSPEKYYDIRIWRIINVMMWLKVYKVNYLAKS